MKITEWLKTRKREKEQEKEVIEISRKLLKLQFQATRHDIRKCREHEEYSAKVHKRKHQRDYVR